jgi:hypothetical protein
MPPKTGPSTPDIVMTTPAKPDIHFITLGGVISGIMTILRELRPDPPMPCSALQTMSWLRDFEKPQHKEKLMNIKKARVKAFLRPIISPMRANVTAQPT